MYVFFHYDTKQQLELETKENDISYKTPSHVLKSFPELQLRHKSACRPQSCGPGREAVCFRGRSAQRDRKAFLDKSLISPCLHFLLCEMGLVMGRGCLRTVYRGIRKSFVRSVDDYVVMD